MIILGETYGELVGIHLVSTLGQGLAVNLKDFGKKIGGWG